MTSSQLWQKTPNEQTSFGHTHQSTPLRVFKVWSIWHNTCLNRIVFTRQVTCGPRPSRRLESSSTTRSRLTYVHCEWVTVCFHGPHLFELMKMGWERRRDGRSATRGARVRVELPNDASVLSEPSKTSVQGPAATSIVLPEGKDWDRQPLTSRTPVGSSCSTLVKSTCKLGPDPSKERRLTVSCVLRPALHTVLHIIRLNNDCVLHCVLFVAVCMAHSLMLKRTATPMIHCRDSARLKPGLQRHPSRSKAAEVDSWICQLINKWSETHSLSLGSCVDFGLAHCHQRKLWLKNDVFLTAPNADVI